MILFFLGLCIGSIIFLTGALLIVHKTNNTSALLRERLVAEETSKRHFMILANKFEETVSMMTKQLHQKELENTALRCRMPSESVSKGI